MSAGAQLRRTIKRGLKASLSLVGQLSARDPDRSVILTYHSVGEHRHEMTVSDVAFREQMAWLADNTHVNTLERAARGQPGVAITFDDGYRNNLTVAAPILGKHQFPATVFMVAGRAGATLDGERDIEGGALMTWDEVRALASLGVEIGSHTMTHPRLAALEPIQQQPEIADAKARIEEELGHTVRHFAYPYGSALDYNFLSVELAQAAGYTAAVTNRYGINRPNDNPWQLRRIWIDATDDLPTFAAKVTGRLDGLRLLDSSVGMHARRLVNRLLHVR